MTANHSTRALHAAPRVNQAPRIDPGPHVFVAPELVGQEYEVIRDENDSDEDYALRCELFALATEAAKKP
jgi:hypothetical protein